MTTQRKAKFKFVRTSINDVIIDVFLEDGARLCQLTQITAYVPGKSKEQWEAVLVDGTYLESQMGENRTQFSRRLVHIRDNMAAIRERNKARQTTNTEPRLRDRKETSDETQADG